MYYDEFVDRRAQGCVMIDDILLTIQMIASDKTVKLRYQFYFTSQGNVHRVMKSI